VSVSKRGFPGLDGLRFYAALGVAITHAEQVASWAGVANVYPLVSTLGDTCVSGFFVLSGFLITFLLLDEFESGGIHLLNFYARRALRIWPVYFALIILAFFILPAIPAMQVPGHDPAWTTSWWSNFSLYVILRHTSRCFGSHPSPSPASFGLLVSKNGFILYGRWCFVRGLDQPSQSLPSLLSHGLAQAGSLGAFPT
jgi:peptidoglycan/LPS O-acetylase OafA/YrhL